MRMGSMAKMIGVSGWLLVCAALTGGMAWAGEKPYKVDVPSGASIGKDATSTATVVAAVLRIPNPLLDLRELVTKGVSVKDALAPRVILLLLGDGTLIRSADPVWGGAPFAKVKIPLSKYAPALERMRAKGYFGVGRRRQMHFGPDAETHMIFVRREGDWFLMQSWHEFYETGENIVDTENGLQPLDGRDRSAVLAAQPKAYRDFRAMWADVKQTLLDLAPPQAKPDKNLDIQINWEWVERPR